MKDPALVDTLPSQPKEDGDDHKRVGQYQILEHIGEGGMGAVYKAFDPKLDRVVALKILHREHPMSILRFRREARIIAQLSHPNIAEVYELSENPPFIAMQFIDGVAIDCAETDRVVALRDAARALHRAHEQNVIHRDIKPANILVDRSGHAYVLDFGIAKRLDAHDLTRTGQITGTPAYMAPEQALGKKSLDARTDVYGLGATLYHVLTGCPPHEGEHAYEVIRKVIDDEPAIPSGVPRELVLITQRAMAKEPHERYLTASDLADDIDRYLTHRPVLARPPSRVYRLRKGLRRHPWIVALSAFSLFATAALATVGLRSLEPEWPVVIRQSFDQAELDPRWKTLRGEVRVHDGALCSKNGHALFDVPLGPDVNVEYSAVIPHDSRDPRELSAFVSGSSANGLVNGYSAEFFIVDDFRRSFHGLIRMRLMARSVPTEPPERGRTYQLGVEKRSARLKTTADDQTVIELEDQAPLSGPDHDRFGIGSKGDHVHYDNIVVRVPLESARAFAARAVTRLDWASAEIALASILDAETSPEQRSATAILHAEALLRTGRAAEAKLARGLVDETQLNYEGRLATAALDAELAAERGDFSAAFNALRRETPMGGRWPTESDRIRAGGRRVLWRMRRLESAERQLLLDAELARSEPAPFTIDVYLALARERAMNIDELPPQVQPLAAPFFGFTEAARFADQAAAAADKLYTKQFTAEYLSDVGLWAIAEGRSAEAAAWFARADAIASLGPVEPHEIGTFGYALLGNADEVRARLLRTDNDTPTDMVWKARAMFVLNDHVAAREAYRELLRRVPASHYETLEAGLVMQEISPDDFERALDSATFDVPLQYWEHRAAILGLAAELAGHRERAIAHYQAAQQVKVVAVALHLLAKQRLATLSP